MSEFCAQKTALLLEYTRLTKTYSDVVTALDAAMGTFPKIGIQRTLSGRRGNPPESGDSQARDGGPYPGPWMLEGRRVIQTQEAASHRSVNLGLRWPNH